MPIKTHSAIAPSTASRMLDLHKSTQFVMEGIAEEQRQTQQRVEAVERLCKNMARDVTKLHRRMDAAEGRLENHKRQLDAVDSDVREVRQRTEMVQSTLHSYLQPQPDMPDEPEDAEPGQECLDFFTMTDQEKDKARKDFGTWARKSLMRIPNLHKEKTQGEYGAYIQYCATKDKFWVFRGNTCMRAFYRTFKTYDEGVAYRNAVLDMFDIRLVEDIPTKDPGVRNYRIETKLRRVLK